MSESASEHGHWPVKNETFINEPVGEPRRELGPVVSELVWDQVTGK